MSITLHLCNRWEKTELKSQVSFAIGGDWGKAPDFSEENYEIAFCIRGAEFKFWSEQKGKTASLRKIKRNSLDKRSLKNGDLLVEISGGGPDQPVGRVVLIDNTVLINFEKHKVICTNFLRLIRLKSQVNSKWVNLFLAFFYKTGEIVKYQAGSNNLRNLKFPDFLTIAIPLAPLPEQRAIVTKIEQLFSELDKGIVSFKSAQQKLDIYRQAVLKKAFEGELTKTWREQQNDLPTADELLETTLGSIAKVATGATPKKSNKHFWDNGELAWVTSGALNDLFVNQPSALITQKAINSTNCKIFPKGTLLVAMYGEGKTRGKCSELLIEAATNQAIAAILINDEFKESKKYIKWFLLKNYKDIRLLSSGGVQPNLNLTKIKETKLPFPSLREQTKIVQEIESRLSVCDKLSETLKQQLKKAEALRQSILKKAFEGRLLTDAEIQTCQQQADWEPAEQLLARIKAESAKNPTAKPRKKQT